MTVPIEYELASAEFASFMLDLRQTLELETTNQAWGVLVGVFGTFQRRLTAGEGLKFARALPPLLRAAFVQDWHVAPVRAPFLDRAQLEDEVMAYHRDHQFAARGCIAVTAATLWRHVDVPRLRNALEQISPEAGSFWSG